MTLEFYSNKMKKFLTISFCAAVFGLLLASCNHKEPGRAYMPDMSYSRAYETYAPTDAIEKAGAHYNQKPVLGTIARGDAFPFKIGNDSTGYAQSAAVKNPLIKAEVDMPEAERLYLVNCAICHGSKLDGNGPLWNNGDGPYSAAPKNFMDPAVKLLTEGTMFHAVTYGKGQMGSYASQLTTKQRWMVIAYIKDKQGPAKADSTGAAAPAGGMVSDTTATAKK